MLINKKQLINNFLQIRIKYEGKINVYKLDNMISNKQKETNIVKEE